MSFAVTRKYYVDFITLSGNMQSATLQQSWQTVFIAKFTVNSWHQFTVTFCDCSTRYIY